jgi:hypothetical protein
MSLSRVPSPLCIRWKITDTRLFKPGMVPGFEWTARWKDSVVDTIDTWSSADTAVVGLTEGYTGGAVQLHVRPFQPKSGDRLDRSWVTNGEKQTVVLPPYAITDMDSAVQIIDQYMLKEMSNFCRRLLKSEQLCKTYFFAINMMTKTPDEGARNMLHNTLKLWSSIRMSTKSWEIVGDDTLGISRSIIDDLTSPLHGKIPLPPVMGAQLDSILIYQIQTPLRRRVLDDLQRYTLEKRLDNWLLTYLVSFILLHNLSLVTKHDAEYAKKHGLQVGSLSLS